MSASPIALVEAAMVQRLSTLQRPGGVKLQAESYAAQLDDETFAWMRQLPATWVTFDAVTDVRRVGSRTFRVAASFEVLVAQRHLQQDKRRLNDEAKGRDVGVYQLLAQNQLALANQKLGLAIQPLTPGPIRAVMKTQQQREAIAVYAQRFTTVWMDEIPEEAVTPDGILITVGLDYLLKPGDDEADSSDLVTTRET